MQLALDSRRDRANGDRPEPVGRCGGRASDGASAPRRHANHRAAHTPRSSRSTPPADAARGATLATDARALRAPRDAPARAPKRSSRPASPGWSSASATRTRTCAGAGIERAPSGRRRGRRPACCADEVPTSSRRTSTTGAPVAPTCRETRRRPSTGARRRPTQRASGSPVSRPGPMGTGFEPRARRSWSARAPFDRRPVAHHPARRRARARDASCSARRRPDAQVHPCLEWRGEISELLDQLGADGVAPAAHRRRTEHRRPVPCRGPGRPLRHLPRTGDVRRRRCEADVLRRRRRRRSTSCDAVASSDVQPARRRPAHRPRPGLTRELAGLQRPTCPRRSALRAEVCPHDPDVAPPPPGPVRRPRMPCSTSPAALAGLFDISRTDRDAEVGEDRRRDVVAAERRPAAPAPCWRRRCRARRPAARRP